MALTSQICVVRRRLPPPTPGPGVSSETSDTRRGNMVLFLELWILRTCRAAQKRGRRRVY